MDIFFFVTIIVLAGILADVITKTQKNRIEIKRLKIEEDKLAIQRLELEMQREQNKLNERGF